MSVKIKKTFALHCNNCPINSSENIKYDKKILGNKTFRVYENSYHNYTIL